MKRYRELYDTEMVKGAALPFALPAWIARAPFEEYLDMTIESAVDGRAVLTMPFKVKHAQGKGLMHGGAVTALADTAVAMAIKSILPEGSHFVTTELTLTFHAPIQGGTVKAVATTVREDERTLRGIAEVFDAEGVKTATFQSLFRIKRASRPA
ncbi:acyl-CoA thioesterase [Geotalea uraniireducens]|uniref:Acyl-CoA thioesterase n=2 Tax=Geotalea uraniireducens TaxID=351604 RepID=A0ABM8EIM2_9BACT|nr:acyl-CoA thioesterase [Geotalea uraniireducens]